jgi:hypothetical protein
MDIPLVGSCALMQEERPLVILVLAWNFLDEIITKIRTMRRPVHSDKFVKKYIFALDDTAESVLCNLF